MKKNRMKTIGCIIALTVTLILNLQYAFLDYGLGINNLGYQVFAQTGGGGASSGDGSSGGGGSSSGDSSGGDSSEDGGSGSSSSGGSGGLDTKYVRTTRDCVYTFYGKAGAKITIFGGTIITIGADGTATYTAVNAEVSCAGGGNEACSPQNCPVNPTN